MQSKHRPAGKNSPLFENNWTYAQPVSLDDFSAEDWALLEHQRVPYGASQRAKQALDMLTAQADARPSATRSTIMNIACRPPP